MPFPSVDVQGGLFPPDLLERAAQGEDAAAQQPQDFHLPKSARLADETQSAFSDIRVHWASWQRRANPADVARAAFVEPLLERLGYSSLHFQRANLEAGGASFDIHRRTHDAEDAAPVHIVADADLDRRGERARRSPHAELQDFLNRSEALWGILANGPKIRILRDSAGRSRPAFLEFDLEAMIDGNAYADFVLLYRLLHRSRFPWPEAPAHQCPLELLYQQGIEEGGRVRDKLRDGVKQALETLGGALLRRESNHDLRAAFDAGELDAQTFYRQLLNFVYRLLFLMVTEERKLLAGGGDPDKYAVFHKYYGVGRLRDLADKPTEDDDYADLWIGLRQTFRVCREEDAAAQVGLSPLNGELFGDAACRHIERAQCANDQLLEAVRRLSNYRAEDGRLRRVNYAHLDVEELGSVYESLLDYAPRISPDRRNFHLAAGSERKQTGSYYTPPELVRELVDSALVPVMQERLDAASTSEEKENALLALRVCDPAAGSGHFLLAAARRIARELARIRTGQREPDPKTHREALRDVVQHCIYAVDKNPLAVDLCKVALWIEAHAAGLPLSFLDHHVKHGDSLVGVLDRRVLKEGIPDGAYTIVTGDDKRAANDYKKRNRAERRGEEDTQMGLPWDPKDWDSLADQAAAFTLRAQRSSADVRTLEAEYKEMHAEGSPAWKLRAACDTWTYAFFAPLTPPLTDGLDRVPTSRHLADALTDLTLHPGLFPAAQAAAKEHPYFHWAIDFADVLRDGGFDVVLGNPPWERLKLQEKEFFAARPEPEARDIANAPNKAARQRLINALQGRSQHLADDFDNARRHAESSSLFARQSQRFPLAGRGDVNTYSIFAELGRELLAPTGRAGMIVPSGLAFDATTQAFFRDLVDCQSIAALYDFENREKVFPGIDSRIKFSLLTMSGENSPIAQAEFAFFLYRSEQLRDVGNEERRIPLTAADFALFNPNTRTCPIFRSRRDMEIARKMYQEAGVFWQEANGTAERNPWGVKFSAMFHMSGDSNLFRTREWLEDAGYILEGNRFALGDDCYLPLYEAKLFHQFDHRFATFADLPRSQIEKGNAREITAIEKVNADTVIIPRYWVHESEVLARTVDDGDNDAARPGRAVEEQPGLAGPSSALRRSTGSRSEPGNRSPKHHARDESADWYRSHDSSSGSGRWRTTNRGWLWAFRNITRPTDRRTAISTITPATAVSDHGSMMKAQGQEWLQAFRGIARATDRRTTAVTPIPSVGIGHSAFLADYADATAIASALVLANMNSLPLDWAARMSVGGTHFSFFIVKQLPILPPEAYIEESQAGPAWVELVVPRVLELTYTAWDLQAFAEDLGYEGEPFVWGEERRHKLKSELDAIYAHMYGLERDEIEWILEPEEPSVSFPALQRSEEKEFGEYRTKRYVLHAYDQLARGELPDLAEVPAEIRARRA